MKTRVFRYVILYNVWLQLLLSASCDIPTYKVDDFTPRIRSNPQGADEYFNKGLVYFISRNQKDALDAFSHAAELDPLDGQTQFFLGLTNVDLGDNAAALRCFNRIFADSVISSASHEQLAVMASIQGDSNREIAFLEQAILNNDPHPMLLRYRLGLAYLRTGREDDAMSILNWIMHNNPSAAGDYGIYFILGTVYLQKGELDNAIDLLTQQIHNNSGYSRIADTYFNLGSAFIRKREYLAAIEQMERVIELQPDNAEAYCSLAISYMQIGQHESMQQIIDVLAKVNPEYAAKLIDSMNSTTDRNNK